MREKPTNTPIIYSVYQLCMVAPTCFGIILPSSESVASAFWEMLNWGHNMPIHNILSTAPQLSIRL
jgi:phospholipid N-methyltransferase